MTMKRLIFLLSPLMLASATVAAAGPAYGQAAEMAKTAGLQSPEVPDVPALAEPALLSTAQKKRADMLISIFENSTLELQYAYVENIKDGRGYTAGRAGFCSGTGDMLIVVERYVKAAPGNLLAKYLPRLRELAKTSSDSAEGLDGFPTAWEKSAADPLFRAAQDSVSDELYYIPALKLGQKLGLEKDFSKIALYEAAIQHGTAGDHDGLGAMIKRASQKAKPPSAGGEEGAWLKSFLLVRRETLAHASDPATAAAWAESVGRADAMLAVFASGNMDFLGPITVNPYGDAFVIPE
jgi:chitosanase